MSADAGGTGFDELEEHEEHENHEAWVIPYADMLTLLMALFMMLFAISSVDLAKFEALADGLNAEFGGGGGPSGVLDGDTGLVDQGGDASALAPVLEIPVPEVPIPEIPLLPVGTGSPGRTSVEEAARGERAEAALEREEQRAVEAALDQEQLSALQGRLHQHASASGIADSIDYRREARGLVVTVVADPVLFAPGRADVEPAGAELLAGIAAALRDLPNRVTIEGHTDDVPISTSRFRSNWELSTARATEVLRHLVQLGLPADRLAASGYGEQRPLASNGDPAGRAANRRVELVVHALAS